MDCNDSIKYSIVGSEIISLIIGTVLSVVNTLVATEPFIFENSFSIMHHYVPTLPHAVHRIRRISSFLHFENTLSKAHYTLQIIEQFLLYMS